MQSQAFLPFYRKTEYCFARATELRFDFFLALLQYQQFISEHQDICAIKIVVVSSFSFQAIAVSFKEKYRRNRISKMASINRHFIQHKLWFYVSLCCMAYIMYHQWFGTDNNQLPNSLQPLHHGRPPRGTIQTGMPWPMPFM